MVDYLELISVVAIFHDKAYTFISELVLSAYQIRVEVLYSIIYLLLVRMKPDLLMLC